MPLKCFRIIVVTCVLSLLAFGGCARSKPARFYILTSVVGVPAGNLPAPGENGLSIAIGPIEFPEYLNRPQIVTRTSPNQINLAEFDRWAEPLRVRFPRVLAENLAALLQTQRVTVTPWEGTRPIDLRVSVDVVRFDGTPGGDVSLITRWTLLGTGGNELVAPRAFRSNVSTQQEGYEGVAAAMSESMGKFSREIAKVIRDRK